MVHCDHHATSKNKAFREVYPSLFYLEETIRMLAGAIYVDIISMQNNHVL